MHSVIIRSRKTNEHMIRVFSRIFEYGCKIRCAVNCNIERVLCTQIGIPKRYLKERAKTVFLNGKVVDDCKKALVHNGDIIALSAAMPGLVGAMLRSKGKLSPMRSSISSKQSYDKANPLIQNNIIIGLVTLKLFNLVSKERTPSLLVSSNVLQFNTTELKRVMRDIMECCLKGVEIYFDKLKISHDFNLSKLKVKHINSTLEFCKSYSRHN